MSKDSALYGEMQSLGYQCIKDGQYYLIKNWPSDYGIF
jgi:hypothetical protein